MRFVAGLLVSVVVLFLSACLVFFTLSYDCEVSWRDSGLKWRYRGGACQVQTPAGRWVPADASAGGVRRQAGTQESPQ